MELEPILFDRIDIVVMRENANNDEEASYVNIMPDGCTYPG